LDIVQVDESESLFNLNSVDLSRPRIISFQLEVSNVIGGFRDVEDIFRDQFNRGIDSNDYSCIYFLGHAIPSLLLTTLVVKSLLMDPPRSERCWLRVVVLVLEVAL
jgi:hypothetical protein